MNELERWYQSYKNDFQNVLEENKKKLDAKDKIKM